MKIELPNCLITLPGEDKKEILLVGGGRAPVPNWLKTAAKGRELWCIDHGADACFNAGIIPARLIGDFDSCERKSLSWCEQNGTLIESFPPEKDFTDTQLALSRLPENSFAVLTGAFGDRFDHVYSTVFSFANASVKGVIADELELLLPLLPKETATIAFKAPYPFAISLLPLSTKCAGVSIDGVKWELNDAELCADNPYAVSNELKKDTDTINVSVLSGFLALYARWN